MRHVIGLSSTRHPLNQSNAKLKKNGDLIGHVFERFFSFSSLKYSIIGFIAPKWGWHTK